MLCKIVEMVVDSMKRQKMKKKQCDKQEKLLNYVMNGFFQLVNRCLSTNLIVLFCLNSAKSRTICILTSLGKNAISPDCHIQIG